LYAVGIAPVSPITVGIVRADPTDQDALPGAAVFRLAGPNDERLARCEPGALRRRPGDTEGAGPAAATTMTADPQRIAVTVDVLTEIVIDRPLAQVAAYAADPTNAPAWYHNIRSVTGRPRHPSPVGSRLAFVAQFLGPATGLHVRHHALEPQALLMMRTAQGPFPMETTYTWAAIDDNQPHPHDPAQPWRTRRVQPHRCAGHDRRDASGQPQRSRKPQGHHRTATRTVGAETPTGAAVGSFSAWEPREAPVLWWIGAVVALAACVGARGRGNRRLLSHVELGRTAPDRTGGWRG